MPLAPAADVAADVGVVVVAAAAAECGDGTVVLVLVVPVVWRFGRVGTRGLRVEERESDSRESAGECSREET